MSEPLEYVERLLDQHIDDLRPHELRSFIELAYSMTGIALTPAKKELVTARLRRRLYALNLQGFGEYLAYLLSPEGVQESASFVDAITTNTTQFFREPHHFQALRESVMPDICASERFRHDGCVHLWSAGCSSGNEAYSLSMALSDYFGGDTQRYDILATDISQKMLVKARQAVYDSAEVEPHMPALARARFMMRGKGAQTGKYRVVPELRQRVSFRYLNLVLDEIQMAECFDIIFCRNVIIYFDESTRIRLMKRLYDCLAPGGFLFLGHSETLTGLNADFRLVSPTIYRRPGQSASRSGGTSWTGVSRSS